MAGVRCGGRPWRLGRRHPLVGHNGPQLTCLGCHAVTLRLSIPSQVAQVTMPHDIFISYSSLRLPCDFAFGRELPSGKLTVEWKTLLGGGGQ